MATNCPKTRPNTVSRLLKRKYNFETRPITRWLDVRGKNLAVRESKRYRKRGWTNFILLPREQNFSPQKEERSLNLDNKDFEKCSPGGWEEADKSFRRTQREM